MFGAIVMPGNVSYLNQFFEAKVVVANGADVGAPAMLEEITGTLRLPPSNVLRVNATEPGVGFGQAVPVVRADGRRELAPAEQEPRPGRSRASSPGPTPSPSRSGQARATGAKAALVALAPPGRHRGGRRALQPDVQSSRCRPRRQAYSLFVTVTNLSRAPQYLVTVDLDEAHITGAHRENWNDPLRFTIRLSRRAGRDARVPAGRRARRHGASDDLRIELGGGPGTIRLYTGVGELGIVLSPATSPPPRFSDRLKRPFLPDDELFRAHNRFLGLSTAWRWPPRR
jgi:hypothetical protein